MNHTLKTLLVTTLLATPSIFGASAAPTNDAANVQELSGLSEVAMLDAFATYKPIRLLKEIFPSPFEKRIILSSDFTKRKGPEALRSNPYLSETYLETFCYMLNLLSSTSAVDTLLYSNRLVDLMESHQKDGISMLDYATKVAQLFEKELSITNQIRLDRSPQIAKDYIRMAQLFLDDKNLSIYNEYISRAENIIHMLDNNIRGLIQNDIDIFYIAVQVEILASLFARLALLVPEGQSKREQYADKATNYSQKVLKYVTVHHEKDSVLINKIIYKQIMLTALYPEGSAKQDAYIQTILEYFKLDNDSPLLNSYRTLQYLKLAQLFSKDSPRRGEYVDLGLRHTNTISYQAESGRDLIEIAFNFIELAKLFPAQSSETEICLNQAVSIFESIIYSSDAPLTDKTNAANNYLAILDLYSDDSPQKRTHADAIATIYQAIANTPSNPSNIKDSADGLKRIAAKFQEDSAEYDHYIAAAKEILKKLG